MPILSTPLLPSCGPQSPNTLSSDSRTLQDSPALDPEETKGAQEPEMDFSGYHTASSLQRGPYPTLPPLLLKQQSENPVPSKNTQ